MPAKRGRTITSFGQFFGGLSGGVTGARLMEMDFDLKRREANFQLKRREAEFDLEKREVDFDMKPKGG